MTHTIDIFKRSETCGDWYKLWNEKSAAHAHRITFDTDLSLDTIEGLKAMLDATSAAGISRSSARGGIFEIHTDLGIWQHVDSRRMDPTTTAKAAKCVFMSWCELGEAEMEAAEEEEA